MTSVMWRLVCAIGLFTALSVPVRMAAQQAANPAPLINLPLLPDAIAPGGAAFKLTVNGTGFVAGSVVHWNGKARTTHFVGESQLNAVVFATDIAKAGTASVTVVNPAPGGGTSNVAYFEVTVPTLTVAFGVLSQFDAGSSPNSVAVADFNGDSKPDLAATNYGGDNVSILLGNGDGTFQPAVSCAVGTHPHSVAVGDFSGDGKLDLAVANTGDAHVSILLGNGNGTFQPAMSYAAGTDPTAVAVADFSGDGKLDLAIANEGIAPGNGDVSILLGNGDGTFQTPVSYGLGSYPGSLAVGDFNGDGKLDLAVANTADANVSILLGNGDGTFQAAVNYAVGETPFIGPVGDFNGDGKLDLAVANEVSGNVSILLGNGDGTFQSAVNYPVPGSPYAPEVGDLNGDGKLDLAVANDDSGTVGDISVFLGNGDGTFQR